MFTTAEALVANADKIASPPRIFHRVNQMVNDPNSTTDDIARVVSEDAGITIRLLRVVNSAYFGYSQKMETLNQAVTALGTQQVRDLVMATTVMEKFEGLPEDLINMESFWQHSLACGVAARALAQARKEINLESFFLGGMLHDVGRLLFISKMPEPSRELMVRCLKCDELLYMVERETFGYDHSDVGAVLLNKWGLPAQLEEAVGAHHHPQKAVKNPMLAAVVHIADVVVHALKMGNSGVSIVPKLSPFAWSRYGMAAIILPQVIEQLDLQYGAMLKALEVKPARRVED